MFAVPYFLLIQVSCEVTQQHCIEVAQEMAKKLFDTRWTLHIPIYHKTMATSYPGDSYILNIRYLMARL